LALVCNSPGERLALDRAIPIGSDVTFLMRLPGNGQLDVLLMSDGQSLWMLRWTRQSGSNRLQAGPAHGLSDLTVGPEKGFPEWYAVRLHIDPRQVVVFLDEALAGHSPIESPGDDLRLALELSQGQVMQVKELRIVPSDPQ
jgi:hypothetical protein